MTPMRALLIVACSMCIAHAKRVVVELPYAKIQSGKCQDIDMIPITSKADCNVAAAALGLSETTARDTHKLALPEGCFLGKRGFLWFSLNPANVGIGGLGRREQLCMRPVSTCADFQCPTGFTAKLGLNIRGAVIANTDTCCEPMYALGLPGDATCPSSYKYIIDLDGCIRAGTSLGGHDCTSYHGGHAGAYGYVGCLLNPWNWCIHFNVDNTNPAAPVPVSDGYSKYVCEKGCSDYNFPYHAQVRGFDLCYSKQSYADAKTGPCEAWCTTDAASGDGCGGCCGDISSKVCSKANTPLGYSFIGSGFCESGYYAGWDAADAANVSTCAAKCDSEPECWFFSLQLGKTCSRYSSEAGQCLDRPEGQSSHVTYQKEHGGWQLAANGYCQSSGVQLGQAGDWMMSKQGCISACDNTVGCNRVVYDNWEGCYMYSEAAMPATCDSDRNKWDYWKPPANAKTSTSTQTTTTTTSTTSTIKTTTPTTSTTRCEDTSDGATDTGGDDCSDYQVHTDDCFGHDYDTDEFTASTMCCACGGGNRSQQP